MLWNSNQYYIIMILYPVYVVIASERTDGLQTRAFRSAGNVDRQSCVDDDNNNSNSSSRSSSFGAYIILYYYVQYGRCVGGRRGVAAEIRRTVIHCNNNSNILFSNWKRKEKRKLVLIGLQIKGDIITRIGL